ncbi:hypothetical protein Acsp05_14010 [Actinokineospora sp. NBRC 105648]|nr:hypothetical protein Acsp05_14010 [Actinokineospora sp. NBRC 105648]
MAGVVLAAACGAPTAGQPVPAAGFGPVSTAQSSTAQSSTAVQSQRSVDGVDLCALLSKPDLDAAGGLVGTPAHRSSAFPDSCGYPLGQGASGDLVLVALYKPLDQVRRDQPEGHEEDTLGNKTWLHCAVADGYRTCTAAVAVRDDRSLVVAITRRDTSEDKVLRLLQPLAERAVERLPRA